MNKSAETNFGISTYSGERVKADKTGLWSCMKTNINPCHVIMSVDAKCVCYVKYIPLNLKLTTLYD